MLLLSTGRKQCKAFPGVYSPSINTDPEGHYEHGGNTNGQPCLDPAGCVPAALRHSQMFPAGYLRVLSLPCSSSQRPGNSALQAPLCHHLSCYIVQPPAHLPCLGWAPASSGPSLSGLNHTKISGGDVGSKTATGLIVLRHLLRQGLGASGHGGDAQPVS